MTGIKDDWIAILCFDSEDHLQAWLDSPERHALLRETDDFIEGTTLQAVRTGCQPIEFAGGFICEARRLKLNAMKTVPVGDLCSFGTCYSEILSG